MAFETPDATLVLALFASIFWQISNLTSSEIEEKYEKNIRRHLSGKPKAYIFGYAWLVLYTFILFSAYYVFHTEAAPNPYFMWTFIAFIVNIAFNKMWTRAFFDDNRPGLALFFLIIMIASGIAYLVLVGLNSLWLSFGLYIWYILWISIACIWNIQYLLESREKTGYIPAGDDMVIDLQHQAVAPTPPKRMSVALKVPPHKNPYTSKLK